MNKEKQFFKAEKWLYKKCKGNCAPVAVVRDGYAQFVGWVYFIERENKPKLRFVINIKDDTFLGIKRICVK